MSFLLWKDYHSLSHSLDDDFKPLFLSRVHLMHYQGCHGCDKNSENSIKSVLPIPWAFAVHTLDEKGIPSTFLIQELLWVANDSAQHLINEWSPRFLFLEFHCSSRWRMPNENLENQNLGLHLLIKYCVESLRYSLFSLCISLSSITCI